MLLRIHKQQIVELLPHFERLFKTGNFASPGEKEILLEHQRLVDELEKTKENVFAAEDALQKFRTDHMKVIFPEK